MTTHDEIIRRVAALRGYMAEQQLDALLIPHDDEHLGEYIPAEAERLAWLTGFNGSAGQAVLLAGQAALFVDGRYTLQARQQAPAPLFQCRHLIDEPPLEWLASQLHAGQRVGVDPRLHSLRWFRQAEARLARSGLSLVALENNPVDALWLDRPAPGKAAARLYPEQLAGQSSQQKRQAIASQLRQQGLDAALLTQADSINWLLNLRGRDIPCLPVVLGFALLHADASLDLFIDPDKLPAEELQQHAGADVRLHPTRQLGALLTRLGTEQRRVLADADTSNAWSQLRLEAAGASLVQGPDPCLLPKACKNAVEQQGMRDAHRQDAVAMCQFLAWLEERVANGDAADEASLAEQLARFREARPGYLEPSFDSISALGPNAALPHYRHSNGTPRALGLDGLYLIDSGGHYETGTTDITRTVKVGAVSDEMRQQFTRVLQGHMALDSARFPRGTSGIQLDVLARLPLWQAGFNYDHGTGHGVGHGLSVHEGPQRISPKGSLVPLAPGMVLSNEPGYYREGAFGIRCENLLLVEEDDSAGGEISRLRFARLTLVPFDIRLLDTSLLSAAEVDWLNGYHAEIRQQIAPLLDEATRHWLAQATRPL